MTPKNEEKKGPLDLGRLTFGARVRNYFLTGLVIAAPIGITLYITWAFIGWVDSTVKPYIPHIYNPDNYLPFSVPGVGLVFSFLILTILGFLTANFVGRSLLTFGEVLVGRMPLVRNLYNALKQIFETALSQKGKTFTKAVVIEYPRRGLWALAFVATETKGEVAHRIEDYEQPGDDHQGYISVFLPTTPNPTSGFLLFVPRADIIMLDMSVEDAAKLVVSAGLVSPNFIKKNASPEDQKKALELLGVEKGEGQKGKASNGANSENKESKEGKEPKIAQSEPARAEEASEQKEVEPAQ
ncbi:DUF502 domain-containing protein [uncultured Cohaesibacter sp.]|uniref:DUF502 domain-containing protein n=1 Tax=uncultured Cohaesibacter sp. TaxID=1002546 RepID=UPI0029C809D2|nr:DUF502 domain-containing protein [uncultured Cohaesibacter sp.]